MIYFEENIQPFTAESGMKVSPIACELTDNRQGYYLGDEWKEEVEAKGATTEQITKDDLIIEDEFI